MYQEVFKLHADLLKALAHPRRLEIINLLKGQELSVTDMRGMLGLPQANLSQHLMVLRKYGAVKCRKSGKQVFYKIAHANFIKASDALRRVLIERHYRDPLGKELSASMSHFLPVVSDPVCGMRLPAKTAAASYSYQGRQYYFCATGCRRKFIRAPKKYISKEELVHVSK